MTDFKAEREALMPQAEAGLDSTLTALKRATKN